MNELHGNVCIEGAEPIVSFLLVELREMSFKEHLLFGGAPHFVTHETQELGTGGEKGQTQREREGEREKAKKYV